MKHKAFAFLLLIIVSLFSLMVMTACGGDDEEDVTPPVVKDEDSDKPDQPKGKDDDNYYVKYEVQCGSQISSAAYMERILTYKDVNDEKKISINSFEWEGTYGPFKKGDKVYLYVITSQPAKYNTNARLSVSKNQEPFAIKAEERESEKIRLEYRIDST